MKLIQTVVLSLALLFAPALFAKDAPVAPTVAEKLSKATLAVYRGANICKWNEVPGFFGETEYEWGCKFQSRFTCTATVVDQADRTEFVGLTAGHCFDWDAEDEYYVSETVQDQPVLHKIKLLKFENDDRYDYALFTFHSLTQYPTMDVDTGVTPSLGTQVVNINYAFGLTKQVVRGVVESDIIATPIPRMKDSKGRFLVNIGIGPGASGSAVVDESTGKIVGLVEAIYPGTQMPTLVMPMGQTFMNFVQDDSAGLKPQAPVGAPPEPPPAPEPETLWHHIVRAFKEFFQRIF